MPAEQRTHGSQRSFHTDVLVLCALLALGSVVLGAFSWSRPTRAASTVTYTQTGALSYTAPTGATSPYGTAGVVTREPVYLSAVKQLSVTYAYRIAAPSKIAAEGTEHLSMRVSNDGGLVHTVSLTPPRRFADGTFSTTWTLSLTTIDAIASSFAAAGRGGGGPVTVSILPDVTVVGRLGTTPLRTTFHRAIDFTLASTTLSPAPSPSSSGAPSSQTHAADVGKPIITTAAGTLSVPDGRSATLALGVSVQDGRIASIVVLAASLVGLGLVGLPLRKKLNSADERVRIGVRFASSLVAVNSLPEPPETVSVDVSSFEGLMQIARQLECPVLHLHASSFDEYAVVDNGTVYHYRIGAAGTIVGRTSRSRPRGRHAESKGGDTETRAATV